MDPFLIVDRARDQNLSITGARILHAVHNGNTKQTAIAADLKLSTAAIGSQVADLIKAKLLTKTRDTENETIVILALTPAGKSKIKAIIQ